MQKVKLELLLAYENGCVDEVLDKYGIVVEDEAMPINIKKAKVLVLGAMPHLKNYQMAARKLGFDDNNIEYVTDYDRLTGFNTSKLEYSNTYSDIIIGPNPHSMKGNEGYSSLLSKMQTNKDRYPRVIVASSNNEIKFSITNFKDCLTRTRMFEQKYESE